MQQNMPPMQELVIEDQAPESELKESDGTMRVGEMHVDDNDILADLAEAQLEPIETESGRFPAKLEGDKSVAAEDSKSVDRRLDTVEVQAAAPDTM